jgi:hypothetical protein
MEEMLRTIWTGVMIKPQGNPHQPAITDSVSALN